MCGSPYGPSCWFYHANTTCSAANAVGFVSGWLVSPASNVTVWTAYEGAGPGDSDTFAFYPNFPAEALGAMVPMTDSDADVAQASCVRYTDFVNGGRPLDVFTAAVLAIGGRGQEVLTDAFSVEDILTGEWFVTGGAFVAW